MLSYCHRCFSVDEAARLAGIRRNSIDVMAHRLPAAFPPKRAGRRWFSVKDIAVLAVSRELERGGLQMSAALACAADHLGDEPEPDAILVAPPGRSGGRIIGDRDVARLLVEQSQFLIPVGAIVGRITAACSEIYREAA